MYLNVKVYPDHVVIEGSVIMRPRRMSVEQWSDYWENCKTGVRDTGCKDSWSKGTIKGTMMDMKRVLNMPKPPADYREVVIAAIIGSVIAMVVAGLLALTMQ